MGSVGKATNRGNANDYDYASGSFESAIQKFKDQTGANISDRILKKVKTKKISEATLREALSTIAKIVNEDGIQIKSLESVQSKKSFMAYSDGKSITINEQYFGMAPDDLTRVFDASGNHPNRGNLTAAQAVVAHEMGHNLEYTHILNKVANVDNQILRNMVMQDNWNNGVRWSAPSYSLDAILQARQTLGITGNLKASASNISGYASQSPSECVAEAFADVKGNGSNANPLSIEIVKNITSSK